MPHEDVAELLGQHPPPLVLRRELPFPVQDDRAASGDVAERRAGAVRQGALDDGDTVQVDDRLNVNRRPLLRECQQAPGPVAGQSRNKSRRL